MARWTASAKWAADPALDGQCDMPLSLRLSEGLGVILGLKLPLIILDASPAEQIGTFLVANP